MRIAQLTEQSRVAEAARFGMSPEQMGSPSSKKKKAVQPLMKKVMALPELAAEVEDTEFMNQETLLDSDDERAN